MKFRKKPIVIEAFQFTGSGSMVDWPQEFIEACILDHEKTDKGVKAIFSIDTLEGNMRIAHGDYVIKGVSGEFYPCKPDIFEKSYDAVEGD